MATYFLWQCGSCGYSVEVSGPHEFWRDEGEIHILPHPLSKRGVEGLAAKAYCPRCDSLETVPLVEFTEPVEDGFAVKVDKIKPEYWDRLPRELREMMLQEAQEPGSTEIGRELFESIHASSRHYTREDFVTQFRGLVYAELFDSQILHCPECGGEMAYSRPADEPFRCPKCRATAFEFVTISKIT